MALDDTIILQIESAISYEFQDKSYIELLFEDNGKAREFAWIGDSLIEYFYRRWLADKKGYQQSKTRNGVYLTNNKELKGLAIHIGLASILNTNNTKKLGTFVEGLIYTVALDSKDVEVAEEVFKLCYLENPRAVESAERVRKGNNVVPRKQLARELAYSRYS
ncbi:MAG: hypothetical protein AABW84_02045 [Nanoarchaeota archaeon]